MDFLDNLVGSAKVALQQFLDCTKEDSLKTPDEPMQCTDETSDSTEPSGDTADSTNSNIDSSGAKDESDGRYDECGSPLSDSALEEEPDCDRMMYCWGNTANGELGLGGIEDLHIPLPRELKFTHSNKVKAVSCGSSHTLVLLHNGQLYSCGNNDFGQLGHDKPRTKLQMIEALASYKIIAVSCGENHSLALDQWGQVFSWGGNNHGQLGSHVGEATYMSKPKVVKGLVTSTVVQIACGHWHNLALTNKGELFSWGLNDSGQLGLGLKVPSVPTPSLITSLVGLPISLIACGGFHTFVVSKSGAVYGWGRNRFGQLGLNSELDHIYPSQLKTLRTINVKYIDCGEDFSVFLTQEGGVLSCGAGAYGQLGHGGTANEALPKKIIELMGTAVTQIACGRRHTLTFVESRDKVYAFGLGSSGQLGTKLQVNASVPTVVQGPWLSGKPYIEGIYSGGDHCFALVSSKKKPSDYRACPPDSCIWSIKVEKMIECQKVGENQTVDQDLLTYLETVLASQACINGSFLLPNDRHYCCTTRHHGIDFRNAQACFTAISRSQNSTIKDVCLEALSNIAPNLAASPPDIETLRLYLTLPLYHEFDNARHAFKLQAPFAAALLRLKPEAYKIVGIWYSVSSDEYFERLVRIYKSVVVFMLRNSPGVNREHGIDLNLSDPAIIDCLDVLDRLNKLNNLKPSHMKLNYEIFYMPEILEVVDVRIDFIKWVTDHTNARKFFCNYPFLFDAEAKTMLLQTDQSIQMQTAMNQAVNQTWQQLIFSPVVFPVNAFLELHVSRQNIVDDTIRELSNYSEKDYRKPLKIHFLGEEAEDAGGVRKEFFLLLMTEILDPKYGMFRSDSESNAIWFSEDSFEDETMYYLVGLLCGLAIYNFTIINLPFPLALYKKLLSEPVTLLDLKQLFPSLAKGLQDLLDYSGDDVEDVFCLRFEIQRSAFGEIKTTELKNNGSDTPVTSENKKEYVDLYVDYTLNRGVEKHYRAFHDGFHKVVGSGRVIQLFHAQELMAVVIGNENYDWEALENHADYKGEYNSSHPTIRLFWEVFHDLPETEKRKFLVFLTGSDRVPIQGMKAIKITIQPTNDDRFLPVAHTCFNLLDLPRYSTKERLRYKLTQAIQQTLGFSIV